MSDFSDKPAEWVRHRVDGTVHRALLRSASIVAIDALHNWQPGSAYEAWVPREGERVGVGSGPFATVEAQVTGNTGNGCLLQGFGHIVFLHSNLKPVNDQPTADPVAGALTYKISGVSDSGLITASTAIRLRSNAAIVARESDTITISGGYTMQQWAKEWFDNEVIQAKMRGLQAEGATMFSCDDSIMRSSGALGAVRHVGVTGYEFCWFHRNEAHTLWVNEAEWRALPFNNDWWQQQRKRRRAYADEHGKPLMPKPKPPEERDEFNQLCNFLHFTLPGVEYELHQLSPQQFAVSAIVAGVNASRFFIPNGTLARERDRLGRELRRWAKLDDPGAPAELDRVGAFLQSVMGDVPYVLKKRDGGYAVEFDYGHGVVDRFPFCSVRFAERTQLEKDLRRWADELRTPKQTADEWLLETARELTGVGVELVGPNAIRVEGDSRLTSFSIGVTSNRDAALLEKELKQWGHPFRGNPWPQGDIEWLEETVHDLVGSGKHTADWLGDVFVVKAEFSNQTDSMHVAPEIVTERHMGKLRAQLCEKHWIHDPYTRIGPSAEDEHRAWCEQREIGVRREETMAWLGGTTRFPERFTADRERERKSVVHPWDSADADDVL